jgi:hypothetical protein
MFSRAESSNFDPESGDDLSNAAQKLLQRVESRSQVLRSQVDLKVEIFCDFFLKRALSACLAGTAQDFSQ